MENQREQSTVLVHAGRDVSKSFGFVNMPPVGGSTVLHASSQDMKERPEKFDEGKTNQVIYGTYGGPTHQAFYAAINELTGGAGTWAFSTGLAGCVIPFFAFAKAGDHILVTDSVYGPTREFCECYLSGMGVDVEFYDPLIGSDIEKLIRPNTTLIFMESPGSHTFEMQDVPAIVEVAKRHNVWTMLDNTWATPLFFNPLKIGVDVEIHAATKYIGGHSDILMAIAVANERAWPRIRNVSSVFGQHASADTIYLAHRGLRTMKVRCDAVFQSTRKIVDWFAQLPYVEKILWPAWERDPGYPIWSRDFKGATGVFGVQFDESMTDEKIDKLLDSLKLFGLGYSWGGYESLLIRSYGKRTEKKCPAMNRMIRLSIGLEDTKDLIADLQQALDQARALR